MSDRLSSSVYSPPNPNVLHNVPYEGHYKQWGYSIGYELTPDGQSVPEGGNTAIFRIFPGGLTEPVFVTKPELDATFTVTVLAGEGVFIRSTVDKEVEVLPLSKGVRVVVHPGEAYVYKNTHTSDELVLHDVAMPAYREGDDVDLRYSLLPTEKPEKRPGLLACIARVAGGETRTVYVPTRFFEIVGRALLG